MLFLYNISRRSRRNNREIRELLALAEQGNTPVQDSLAMGLWSSNNPTLAARLKANREIALARHRQESLQDDWKRYGAPAKMAHAAWREAVGAREEPALCAAFVLAYGRGLNSFKETAARLKTDLGLTYEEAASHLQKVALDRYEMLVPLFPDDREAFLELRGLIPLTRGKKYDYFSRAGSPKLRYPERWNEAVAKFLENPHVEDFVQGRDPEPGQLRQWGEEALRDGDIVEAKLVLAWANRHRNRREELGDVLTHELGKLVAEYHASLAVEASATTESSI